MSLKYFCESNTMCYFSWLESNALPRYFIRDSMSALLKEMEYLDNAFDSTLGKKRIVLLLRKYFNDI